MSKLNAMREMDGFSEAEKIALEITENCSRRSRAKNGEPANYKGANDGVSKFVILDSVDDLNDGIKADFFFCGNPCIIIEKV